MASCQSIVSALVFAWESAKRIRARKHIDENGVMHYEIHGPLFFGSATAFAEKFDVLNDPDEITIDFQESKIVDMSSIDAVNKITERYLKLNPEFAVENLLQSEISLKSSFAVVFKCKIAMLSHIFQTH